MSNKPLSEMSPGEIAETEGEPVLENPNIERPVLDLGFGAVAGDGEILTKASDPQLNPDSDPYEERGEPTR